MTDHTVKAQMEHLESLLRKRRQEQLAQDQSDIDLALSDDDQPLGVDNSWSGQHSRLIMPVDGDQ